MKNPFAQNLFAHLRGGAAGPTPTPVAPAPGKAAGQTAADPVQKKDGEDGEDGESEDGDEAAIRADERRRCAAIFAAPAAAGRIELAVTLACMTALPADQAVALLNAAPSAAPVAAAPVNPLAAAMAALGNPQVTPDGGGLSGGGEDDGAAAEADAILRLRAAHSGQMGGPPGRATVSPFRNAPAP